MAKGERILLPVGYTPRYAFSGLMPWPDLEDAAGKTFDPQQRDDIFEVWRLIEPAFHQIDQSETVIELERRRLALIERCERFVSEVGSPEDDEELDALCAYVGGDVRSTLWQTKDVVRAVLNELRRSPEPHGKTERVVRVNVLVTRDALRLMRQEVGGSGSMRAETWGLKPVRRSPAFQRFLSALLGFEISEDDIHNRLKEIDGTGTL